MLDVAPTMPDLRPISRSLGVVLRFLPGDCVFREGEGPSCMYVLLEGRIAIRRGGLLIEEIGPGQALGIVSLLDGETRTITAEALTPCEVSALDTRKFRFAVEEVPHFAWWVMGELAHRLRATNAAL